MPPTAIASNVPKLRDVLTNLPPQIVVELHIRQPCVQVDHLRFLQAAYCRRFVDAEAGHEGSAHDRADAVEPLQ